MDAILFKTTVVCVTAVLGTWALRWRSLTDLSERSFVIRALLMQLSTALALFVALYIVGGQEVTSDVPAYYVPAARAALAGQIPFIDFQLSYAPLFPYVGAGIVALWSSGKAFVLFAIVLNGLALFLWHRTAAACTDRRTARVCTVLYATSGHLAVQTMLGTNQVWIAAALAGSALLLVRGRSTASGFSQAVAVCTTKFLTLLFWPVLWICAPARAAWLLGCALPPLALYGAFAAGGADIFYPLHHEGGMISSGNLPYLVAALIPAGLPESGLLDAMTLSGLTIAIAWLFWSARKLPSRQRPTLLLCALALIGFVFLLVSKKSFTSYAVFFMYPALVVVVARSSRMLATLAFVLLLNLLMAIEPSVWFHLGGNGKALADWLPQVSRPAAAAFVMLEAALLACYVYLAYLSVWSVRRTVAGAISPSSETHSRTACSLV